jgi:hypothetical protein
VVGRIGHVLYYYVDVYEKKYTSLLYNAQLSMIPEHPSFRESEPPSGYLSEELAAVNLRDEIIWSPYAGFD